MAFLNIVGKGWLNILERWFENCEGNLKHNEIRLPSVKYAVFCANPRTFQTPPDGFALVREHTGCFQWVLTLQNLGG